MDASYPSNDWRSFARRHWAAFAIFILGAALAFAEAVYVFLWFTATAQSNGLVPSILGLWTTGNLVSFILYAVFWELVLVGVPILVGVVLVWIWWSRLPSEERLRLHFGKRSKRAGGSGGFSTLLFIVFVIKVYFDGYWNTPISALSLDYVVGSVFTILIWGAIIFGIPAALALAWWISRGAKRQ